MDSGKECLRAVAIVFFLLFFLVPLGLDQTVHSRYFFSGIALAAEGNDEEEPIEPFSTEQQVIADPLERFNRVTFVVNDRLYFWVLKPVAKTYGTFIPEGVRISIRNAFDNILFPVRLVNNTLQGKFEAAWVEVGRFTINSTLGAAGMFDVASRDFGLQARDEDLGQTLGVYGVGPVMYVNWPFFGPSSVRDSLGMLGDTFLNPIYYLPTDAAVDAAIRGGLATNNASLRIGEYEALKEAALDPYVSIRDAYLQNRAKEIGE